MNIGRLKARVIAAARLSAYAIIKAHDGDESNIPDENVLVSAVEALDRHERKAPPQVLDSLNKLKAAAKRMRSAKHAK